MMKASESKKKEAKTDQLDPIYNELQICLVLRLNRWDRSVVIQKYEGKEYPESEWKEILKKDDLKF